MALSGLDIFKLLPKTNCRECGFATCLAFAMQLAKKAISVDKCPYISAEVKQKLLEAARPLIKLIQIGSGDTKFSIGNETVLFRHEEKFHNPCALGCIVDDDISDKLFEETIVNISNIEFVRVGERLKLNLIAIRNKSDDSKKFVNCIKKVFIKTNLNLAIITNNPESLSCALELTFDKNPLIYFSGDLGDIKVIEVLKKYNLPLVVNNVSIDEIDEIIPKLIQAGLSNLILETKTKTTPGKLWDLTQIRRLALKKKNRNFGFPQLVIIKKSDEFSALTQAATFMLKYAGIILLEGFGLEEIFALLTLRQNIYSDPQKPLQVEPKAYAIGQATTNSPVLVTTNFSLTYYTVLGEVEASKIPSYIVAIDTQGMSVLTAWAAEKFTPEFITKGLESSSINDKIKHNKIIIPGYVAAMAKDLELTSKKHVIVGPKEASGIPGLLKTL